jgi:hypothetical protein
VSNDSEFDDLNTMMTTLDADGEDLNTRVSQISTTDSQAFLVGRAPAPPSHIPDSPSSTEKPKSMKAKFKEKFFKKKYEQPS